MPTYKKSVCVYKQTLIFKKTCTYIKPFISKETFSFYSPEKIYLKNPQLEQNVVYFSVLNEAGHAQKKQQMFEVRIWTSRNPYLFGMSLRSVCSAIEINMRFVGCQR